MKRLRQKCCLSEASLFLSSEDNEILADLDATASFFCFSFLRLKKRKATAFSQIIHRQLYRLRQNIAQFLRIQYDSVRRSRIDAYRNKLAFLQHAYLTFCIDETVISHWCQEDFGKVSHHYFRLAKYLILSYMIDEIIRQCAADEQSLAFFQSIGIDVNRQ